MAKGEDTWGCIIAAGLLAAGAWWLWSNYEVRAVSNEPALPVPAEMRPIGLVEITTLDDGSVWRLDADSVSGPRTARQMWVFADHSNNKDMVARETQALYRVNCNTTAYRTLSIVQYDPDGNPIESWTEKELGEQIDYPPPQSNIAAVVREGCRPVYDT